jgi:cation transport ATPase
MKFRILMIAFLAIGINAATAQSKSQKLELHVEGVCSMCKERIETAAMRTTGVKFAEWHKTDKTLHLVYNAKKVEESEIRNVVAATGHRMDDQPADSAAYKSLPDCCKYDDGLESH